MIYVLVHFLTEVKKDCLAQICWLTIHEIWLENLRVSYKKSRLAKMEMIIFAPYLLLG